LFEVCRSELGFPGGNKVRFTLPSGQALRHEPSSTERQLPALPFFPGNKDPLHVLGLFSCQISGQINSNQCWSRRRPSRISTEPSAGRRRSQVRSVPLVSPLNELARSNPSDVMSRNSTSAKNFGSTPVAFGFLIALVNFDFGLTTFVKVLTVRLYAVQSRPHPERRTTRLLRKGGFVAVRHSFLASTF
jgi:hypothetical protein